MVQVIREKVRIWEVEFGHGGFFEAHVVAESAIDAIRKARRLWPGYPLVTRVELEAEAERSRRRRG